MIVVSWGRGAVGSASEWHSEGQGFESPRLHHEKNYEKLEKYRFQAFFNAFPTLIFLKNSS